MSNDLTKKHTTSTHFAIFGGCFKVQVQRNPEPQAVLPRLEVRKLSNLALFAS
jgi:hypothetical protein